MLLMVIVFGVLPVYWPFEMFIFVWLGFGLGVLSISYLWYGDAISDYINNVLPKKREEMRGIEIKKVKIEHDEVKE